MYVSD